MDPSALPSTLLTNWEPIRQLKDGGQGIVFVVHRRSDGQKGVAKIPKGKLDHIELERFSREVKILGEIDHPCIVKLLDHDLTGVRPWYVTPLGVPLEEYWEGRRADRAAADLVDESITLVMGLLQGLAEFHRRGGVHRDIKPGNVIMLSEQDRNEVCPVLIDFGIAIRPGDDRLTEVDERAVANNFAAPHEAFYGMVDEPKPSWDCLGVAWLWGWLLAWGKAPKYGRYHWKFHRFVDDFRCERVRAIIAVCTDASSHMAGASEMLELATSLGLGPNVPERPPESSAPRYDLAANAYASKRSTELLAKVQGHDRRSAAVAVVAPFLPTIGRLLKLEAVSAKEKGLPVAIDPSRDCDTSEWQRLLANQGDSTVLFACTCGTDPPQPFKIWASCAYLKWDPSEQFLPFEVCMQLRHPRVGRLPDDARTAIVNWDWHGGMWIGEKKRCEGATTPEAVALVLRTWLADLTLWAA